MSWRKLHHFRYGADLLCSGQCRGLRGQEEFSGLFSGIRRHADDICAISGFYAAQNGSFFTDCLGQTFDQRLQESSMTRRISF
jgi:hypothetical protein